MEFVVVVGVVDELSEECDSWTDCQSECSDDVRASRGHLLVSSESVEVIKAS
jgi:hypothetical protein